MVYCISLSLGGAAVARADILNFLQQDNKNVWGEVVFLNNNYVDFRIGCSGPVKRFKWSIFNMSVIFHKSCAPIDNDDIGGEPADCKGTKGRWFRLMNAGRENEVNYVNFEDGELTIGIDGARVRERSPKKDQLRLMLMCDHGVGG